MTEKPVPEGYHSVSPYLLVQGAEPLIEFLKKAFGGKEIERLTHPQGRIGHAEVRIGDSVVMLSEAFGDWKAQPAMMYVYLPNVDDTYAKALAAGAKSIMPPADQFYGDRMGGVTDPAGNTWFIATRTETVEPEELARRAAENWK